MFQSNSSSLPLTSISTFQSLIRHRKLALAISFFAIALWLCGGFAAMAQSTSGDIVGTVLDKSGAAISGASVTATNESTGVVSAVQANQYGEFHISNLLAGSYTISASAPNFATYALKGFDVQLNKTGTAKIVLPVATTATNVLVSGNAPAILDTTTVQLQAAFETQELENMPSATITVLNLSLLVPGVASAGGMGDGSGPAVGGMRARSNNYTIEGIDNNNKSVTGPLVYVPSSAVGEFTVITNQFTPEFGHSVGGQFNMVIASGGNKIHGAVYEYSQNRNYNAENAVQGGKVPNPRYDFNRYGAQVGGPIKKDKLFYFANYERQTTGQSSQGYICTPTTAALTSINDGTHNFSTNNLAIWNKYITPYASTTQVTSSNDLACFDGAGPQVTPIYSDGTFNPNTGIFGTNDQVLVPLGNTLVEPPSFSNFQALTTGGNWTISNKDSFRLRYIYNSDSTIDTSASLPAFYQPIPYKYHLIAASEYHTFSPTVTNEARLGFNRYYNVTTSGNFSFPGLDSFPNVLNYDLGINIGPDPNAPQETIQNLYQFTDNISWTKGKHDLKFGFDGRKFISPQSFTQRVRGDYEWDYTTEYLHDVSPSYFGERSSGDAIYYGDQTAFYGFVNDVWHAMPKVSLNFGLRYEFTSVPTGERTQALNAAASVPGLIVFSAPKPQYTNLMPRVGINYALDSNTSIRAGFGMGVDVLYDNLGILSLPPELSQTFDVGSGNCPGYNLTTPQITGTFLANGGLDTTTCGSVGLTTPAEKQAATAAFIPNQKLPYAENWSLGVQHVFRKDYTFEARYLGTRGIHLATQIQLNVTPEVTAANQLPTYIQASAPSDAQLAALPNTLGSIESIPTGHWLPSFYNAGFNATKMTSYQPDSESNYNGLAVSLNRRFKQGLLLDLSYTWSKTMDDATATVNSTSLTPRRPQNPQDVGADYSRSALDRKNRLTLAAVYDLQVFKHSNWLVKNIVGNWSVAPIYTYESPEFFTVLSGDNANLDGDSGGIDRTIFNIQGVSGTGSAVTPLYDPSRSVSQCGGAGLTCNGNLVAYIAQNPNARYIQAAPGTLPTAQRNSEPTQKTNNLDASATKKFNFTERYTMEFSAQAFNVLNHSQFIPGATNSVFPGGVQVANYQEVAKAGSFTTNPAFNQPGTVFTASARTMQLSLKLSF